MISEDYIAFTSCLSTYTIYISIVIHRWQSINDDDNNNIRIRFPWKDDTV